MIIYQTIEWQSLSALVYLHKSDFSDVQEDLIRTNIIADIGNSTK